MAHRVWKKQLTCPTGPLLGGMTCPEGDDATPCTREENMGWRWFLIAMGGLTVVMFVVRFGFFTIYESPKYLMGKGRDEEAVKIVHEVARRNGKPTWITVESLRACEPEGYARDDSTVANAVKRKLEDVKLDRVKALFRTRKLARSTSLIMAVWAFIGLGCVGAS